MNELRIIAQRSPFCYGNDIQLFGGYRDSSGFMAMTEVTISKIEDGLSAPSFLGMTDNVAQGLFDDLYRIGFRPSKVEQAGEKAVSEHIKDLRAISFKLLDITT